MQKDDFDRGVANRRAVLGDEWVDRSLSKATELNAEFQSLITRFAWNDIWGRPGLDHTTRRLLVLGMTMGLARWEEFELHCRAALRGGVAIDKIKETLMQGAIYCGVPAANTAFKIAAEVCAAEGIVLAPAPLDEAHRVSRHHTFSQPQLRVALQGVQEGIPVVLSHALGVDHRMWDDLAATLAGRHPVLRYDHRGHGGSAAPEGPYRIDDLVDDAARVIREWGRGPVAFVGLSMGGMTGQGLAIRHPELVQRLVLANTTSRYPQAGREVFMQRVAAVEQGGMAAIADGVIERYFHADFRAAHPAYVQAMRETVLRSDVRGYAASCQAVGGVDWFDRLGEIRCPVLVIAGDRDMGTPPPMAEAIAAQIPGARLEIIADASHLSVAEQPERFAQLVSGFLNGAR